jgi:hypothetical protein
MSILYYIKTTHDCTIENVIRITFKNSHARTNSKPNVHAFTPFFVLLPSFQFVTICLKGKVH